MKDETYNQFKKDIARWHRKGYEMNFPMVSDFADEDNMEIGVHIELAMFKKVKRLPRGF